MKILNVVSARPNFMKVAPLLKEYKKQTDKIEAKLVHTGQHYDYEMSKIFFDELGISEPDYHLGVGSGTHAGQTAKVMIEFEKVIDVERPDWVVVVGDVNPTMACTIVAVKMGVKVAHVEAGLRSGDRSMPEEINRILTDSIADLLLTPSPDGNRNLGIEGIPEERIRFVGNIMIDTLFNMRKKADGSTILEDLGIKAGNYFFVTLHRPSNVDNEQVFDGLVEVLEQTGEQFSLVWPMHPRSRKKAGEFGLMKRLRAIKSLHLTEPIGYTDSIQLMQHARLVLTDSGGIQEETTALGIPCLTIRDNTERPVTITEGTNILGGTNPQKILELIQLLIGREREINLPKPKYWDGKTAERIVEVLLENRKHKT